MSEKYKILTIEPNNKDDKNDFMDLIITDINNYNEEKFNEHFESIQLELESCLHNKKLIYFREFSYEDTLENQINEIFINNVSNKVDITKFNYNLYSSHVIKYTDDYYIVLYYNNALLDIYLNTELSKDQNPNKEFNLLGSLFMRELNLKCNALFGEVFFIKFNHNGAMINISEYELLYLLKDFLFVSYYTEIGIPGIYFDKKENYKSFFKKEDNITIYNEHKLMSCIFDNKKVWNKYYFRFHDGMEYDEIIKLTDKYNLINIDSITNIFCYDNIEKKDIEIIKKLG